MDRTFNQVRWPECVGWVLALIAALFLINQKAFDFADEGFSFLLSREWARGSSLYSDYRLIYLPGVHVLTGLPLLFFDSSLMAFRAGQVLLMTIAAGLFARQVGGRLGTPLSVLLCLTIAVVASPQPKLVAAALVLTAALQVARGWGSPRWTFLWSLGAGLMFGVREDSAVLLTIIATIPALRQRRPRELITRFMPGLVLGIGFWVAFFALRGDGMALLSHLGHRVVLLLERLGDPSTLIRPKWSWPISLYRLKAFMAVPLAILLHLTYMVLLGFRVWRRRDGESRDRVAIAAVLVGLAYLPQFLLERPDYGHFVDHLPIALTVLCLAAGRKRWAKVSLVLMLIACLGLTSWAVLAHRLEGPLQIYPSPNPQLALPVATLPPWAGKLGPGDLLVLGWAPGWYVAEDLDPPSPYLSTFPRHLDDEARSSLIELVTDSDVRWVITTAGRPIPPGTVGPLKARFEPQAVWRRTTLWRRKR